LFVDNLIIPKNASVSLSLSYFPFSDQPSSQGKNIETNRVALANENETDTPHIEPLGTEPVQDECNEENLQTSEIKDPLDSFSLNPCMFAPTGDIYSYFNRRPMLSSSAATFQYPFRYSCIKSLNNMTPVHSK
jgi:hypothetical protein